MTNTGDKISEIILRDFFISISEKPHTPELSGEINKFLYHLPSRINNDTITIKDPSIYSFMVKYSNESITNIIVGSHIPNIDDSPEFLYIGPNDIDELYDLYLELLRDQSINQSNISKVYGLLEDLGSGNFKHNDLGIASYTRIYELMGNEDNFLKSPLFKKIHLNEHPVTFNTILNESMEDLYILFKCILMMNNKDITILDNIIYGLYDYNLYDYGTLNDALRVKMSKKLNSFITQYQDIKLPKTKSIVLKYIL